MGMMLLTLSPRPHLEPVLHKVDVQPVATPPPATMPSMRLPDPQLEEVHDDLGITVSVASEQTPNELAAASTFALGEDATSTESTFPSEHWQTTVGIARTAGAANLGGRYDGRSEGGAKKAGSKSHTDAIDAGLQWLKNHQDEDGRWDCDQFMRHDDESSEGCTGAGNAVHDIGVTGLALLAFLGDGSTMRSGPYKDTIKKGVLWLRSQQQESGLFGSNSSPDYIYDHAIAAYAMCEAFGLSNSQLLRETAQKGLDYLESQRNPRAVWRYRPQETDNDTSVTGWCIMAYVSGESFGLTINREALPACAAWLDQVSDASGQHGYTKRGEASSRKRDDHSTRFPPDKGAAMTAVGLFCRYFMSQSEKERPVMIAAADLLLSKLPVWDEQAGTIDHYYWYYGTYALFQMGGSHWKTWQSKLESAVVKTQHHDKAKKNLYGSWDPACAWGDDGGRVYSTAILTLTLEAYYRYTRLVR